ncbi:regucalcin-like [Bradysia coprophila]|uniref:regucalcin-like n=1 Tax=Bradysia coprophila TaxID=38358 RepID=UPI00187DAF4A|nr:regucalcin-like [Bradysia coprophila]
MWKFGLYLSFLFSLSSAELTIRAISDKRLSFGYIPHWDASKQSLYVTNALISLIRYDAVTKQLYEGTFTDPNFEIDFFLPTNDCQDCFVASHGLDVYIVHWDGFNSNVTFVRKMTELSGIENLTYVNTAKMDPNNRLLVATWRYDRCNPNGGSPDGSVYLVEADGQTKEIIGGALYPSGLEWDVSASKMYYIDICQLNIKSYDWSIVDGTVRNPKIIYDFRDDFPIDPPVSYYLPVGSNINFDGNLMVALFNTSTIVEINPTTGKLVRTIEMPAETVTGAIYGSKDTLFVTSSVRKSSFDGQKHANSNNPESGKIFIINGLSSGSGAYSHPSFFCFIVILFCKHKMFT